MHTLLVFMRLALTRKMATLARTGQYRVGGACVSLFSTIFSLSCILDIGSRRSHRVCFESYVALAYSASVNSTMPPITLSYVAA